MAIIVVGGSAKGVGKTTLVCGLIAALDRFHWTAVKITTDAHQGLPPIHEEKSAGPETGTARYLAAGAARAFLLTVPPQRNLAQVLDEFWPRIGRGANFIFESNRAMDFVEADLRLLVDGRSTTARTEPKPSFWGAMLLADALVVRADADSVVSGDSVYGEPARPIFHLKHLDNISAEMKRWIEKCPGLTP
jgi:hypothetical protein